MSEFWTACQRLLESYPHRPERFSKDSDAVQLVRRLRELTNTEANELCPNLHWKGDASVGKGKWTNVPWLAVFDARETTSAQKGVYPVVHFSCDEPVGVRIGLGVAATEFRVDLEGKAREVYDQLQPSTIERLREHGFSDVIQGIGARVPIGSGTLASGYTRGMIFERFVRLDELRQNSPTLTSAFAALLDAYKAWVDNVRALPSTPKSFLEIMRWYFDEKIVFYSTNRQSRYYVKSVDETGCEVQRLDANESERVTLTGYESRMAWLRDNFGAGGRAELDGTVARQMTYLQSSELGLAEQRKNLVLLDSHKKTTKNLVELIEEISSPQLYKPMVVALVVSAIAKGELTENRIFFDWLLPKFIEEFREYDREVSDQQLAEGFARLAGDFFWLLAHVEVSQPFSIDHPNPTQIRQRVKYAVFKEPFWQALQSPQCRNDILLTIKTKWNIQMDIEPINRNPNGISVALERLIEDISRDGFTFEPWQIATYVTAIRTKPFVILAGVSGTGKSKLPSLIARHTGGESTRISVRPDWTDSSEALGYVDLQGKFRPGAFVTFARMASLSPSSHFTCIIDEMNLARVEYYFAEILSCIEDRNPSENGGFESDSLLSLQLHENDEQWQQQTIPANLGIVGTVNMDESTHGFSRKVLDRAFTIELSEVDLDWNPDITDENLISSDAEAIWPIEFWHSTATRLNQLSYLDERSLALVQSWIAWLKLVNNCLTCSQLQVGYRIRDEIILFMLNAEEVRSSFRSRHNKAVDPLDLALSMKILPRIVGGSNAIRRTLLGLLGLAIQGQPFDNEDVIGSQVENWDKAGRPAALDRAKLPRSAARLCLMWDRLETEGFTSYWL
jgi:uncharacterized protein YbaR (Trm112 family)